MEAQSQQGMPSSVLTTLQKTSTCQFANRSGLKTYHNNVTSSNPIKVDTLVSFSF